MSHAFGPDEPGQSGVEEASTGLSDVRTVRNLEIPELDVTCDASRWCAAPTAEDGCVLGSKRPRDRNEDVEACPSTLTALQQLVLSRLVDRIDADNTSVVVTNPMSADNHIVYVTEPWQDMCGYTAQQAIGRNPRLTQGRRTNEAATRSMSHALKAQRACKVLVLNYRSGLQEQPFWNMLTINPIHHQGHLMLFMAHLQDYSFQMSQMVSLTPQQFCRSAEFHQRQRHLHNLKENLLAAPAIYESCPDTVLVRSAENAAPTPPAVIKRLGWNKLLLQPEHLIERVVDAIQRMDAEYELADNNGGETDNFLVYGRHKGVSFRVLVQQDTTPGTYRINCTRVSGDTFTYHDLFRKLRDSISTDDFQSAREGVSDFGRASCSSTQRAKFPRIDEDLRIDEVS